MELVRHLFQLLVGVRIGAALFFGAAVTPVLFQVLSSAQAGSVVRPLIRALDVTTVVLIPLLLALAIAFEGRPRGRGWVRVLLLSSVLLLAGVSLFTLSPRMAELRTAAGERLSELPKEHPLRREFGALHGLSSTAMLAELLLLFGVATIPLRRPGTS